MKIEEMVARKRELGYTYEQIAELADLPVGTVQKVLGGYTKSPRYDTVRKLEKVLGYGDRQDQFVMRETAFSYGSIPSGLNTSSEARDGSEIRERRKDGTMVKRQGEYTLEDYYALPEDHRAELIDGVIYDMAAPTEVHQVVQMFIGTRIWNYIDMQLGKCVVFMAPTDVRLDMDDKTMVQPDVLVKCELNAKEKRRIEGAPDFVVEILSPLTRKKDLYIKVHKYSDAGVRELWVVDPRDRRIIVYDFEHDDVINMYTFEDTIPVGIYGGELEIDFSRLKTYLDELYGEDW